MLRGIGVGVLGFFLFLFAGFVVLGNTTGFGGETELSLDYALQEVPIWTILMLLGFLLFIGGPIYYWFLEPILKKRQKTVSYEP